MHQLFRPESALVRKRPEIKRRNDIHQGKGQSPKSLVGGMCRAEGYFQLSYKITHSSSRTYKRKSGIKGSLIYLSFAALDSAAS